MKNIGQPGTLHELRERLGLLQPGDQPRWGLMCVRQMVQHLTFACDVSLGDFPAPPVPARSPAIVKFYALKTGFRWPQNVPTTPVLKKAVEEMEAMPSLDAGVEAVIERLERLAAGAPCIPAHPIFGAMSQADWLRWGYRHTDHHLHQFGR